MGGQSMGDTGHIMRPWHPPVARAEGGDHSDGAVSCACHHLYAIRRGPRAIHQQPRASVDTRPTRLDSGSPAYMRLRHSLKESIIAAQMLTALVLHSHSCMYAHVRTQYAPERAHTQTTRSSTHYGSRRSGAVSGVCTVGNMEIPRCKMSECTPHVFDIFFRRDGARARPAAGCRRGGGKEGGAECLLHMPGKGHVVSAAILVLVRLATWGLGTPGCVAACVCSVLGAQGGVARDRACVRARTH